jgi:hypothetical protein
VVFVVGASVATDPGATRIIIEMLSTNMVLQEEKISEREVGRFPP